MERTATPARAKAAGNSQASPPTATAPVVDFTELDATIMQEARQPMPSRECITDRLGKRTAAGDLELLFVAEEAPSELL